jgi:hypothetical protein
VATTYKSTIEVNVWKEHQCIGCGSRFRYLFKRKKTGQGGTPDAARANAHKAVKAALAREVDQHPCPGCGLYQPDMVASRRTALHGWLIAATVLVLLLVLILVLTDVITTATGAWSAAVACGLLGLVHLLIDRSNPNRDLDRNQQQAQMRVEKGDLWVPPNGLSRPQSSEPPVFGWTTAHAVAYVLFGLGVLALVVPEGLRLAHGWPANPAWYPLAAGPGDEIYTYFPYSITSVKGYWQGTATATIVNAGELGMAAPQLRATSQNDRWGDTIRIGSKESKTSTKTLWVRVLLPADASLEGKSLQVKMTLDVEFPQMQGNNWEPVKQRFEHTDSLRLGGTHAAARYKAWWWGSFVGAIALLGLSSALIVRLATGLRGLAQPTGIFTPGEDAPEVLPAEEPAEVQPVEEAPEVLPADAPRRVEDEGIQRRE